MVVMMKFCGRNKKESVKKAVVFYYDNFDYGIELFLAKCKIQSDGSTVHFYPELNIDLKKFRELKAEIRKKDKK